MPTRMNRPRRMNAPRKSSMFPHTVTVYNTGEEDPITFEKKAHITILRGVLFDASKAANVRESGLANADAVNLIIPFDAEAVNGVTGEKQTYLPPVSYEALEEKARHWTIQPGDNCFFVKGEVVEPGMSFQEINATFDSVHKVTSADEKDFGGLQHIEVGGA